MEDKIFNAKTLRDTANKCLIVAKSNLKSGFEERIKSKCDSRSKSMKFDATVDLLDLVKPEQKSDSGLILPISEIENIFKDILCWLNTCDFVSVDGDFSVSDDKIESISIYLRW